MSSDIKIDKFLEDIKDARDKIYELNGLIQEQEAMGGKVSQDLLDEKMSWEKRIETNWNEIQKIIGNKR